MVIDFAKRWQRLNENTREYTLKVILRLVMDEAVMSDCLVCLGAQKTITLLVGDSQGGLTDPTVRSSIPW